MKNKLKVIVVSLNMLVLITFIFCALYINYQCDKLITSTDELSQSISELDMQVEDCIQEVKELKIELQRYYD